MTNERHETRTDPRWDLILEIAGKLWLYGEHVVEIDPTPAQQRVDVQWAAHQAGRLVGVRTRLDVTPASDRSAVLIMRITYDDPDGHGLVRAQDGLDSLVQAVREQQLVEAQVSRQRPSRPPSSPS